MTYMRLSIKSTNDNPPKGLQLELVGALFKGGAEVLGRGQRFWVLGDEGEAHVGPRGQLLC